MNKIKHKTKAIIMLMVFLFLIGLLFSYFNWTSKYKERIYPKTYIGDINLSGLQISEAEKIISQKISETERTGLIISYNNQEISLPTVLAVNTDLSFPIFNYDLEKTLEKIKNNYYNRSYFSYIFNSLKNSFSQEQIKTEYVLDSERVKQYIRENLKDVEVEPKNANFKVNNKAGVLFDIEPERIGRTIDFDSALETIEKQLASLDNKSKINLKTITARPTVYTADLENLKTEAADLINQGDLKLHASSSTSTVWTIKKEAIASWIISSGKQNKLRLTFDEEKIKLYLTEKIAPLVEKEAALPRYEIKNGKMSSWQTGADGLKINLEQSTANIKNSYLNNKLNDAELVTEIIKSEEAENTDKFNIKEIIGTGHSNFSGSPKNRIHNIKVGAESVNGMLIAPGEEFSLIKTLGEIDAAAGYLPELVIKNNKTIPEYGGGLCQVATTIFRSALESGLPITARQNHSYRVSYYEPAGTDAAVYDPWPDMRFLNDTGNYVLIQSRIEKNDIYFDFWGKRDGRIASSSKPVIYNIVKPAATKIVETDELKPGEKKCTEKAHNGADAYFDYQVIYPSGDVKDKRFKSHYVPWQEVCLVGKYASTSTPINISSSSPTISSSTTN